MAQNNSGDDVTALARELEELATNPTSSSMEETKAKAKTAAKAASQTIKSTARTAKEGVTKTAKAVKEVVDSIDGEELKSTAKDVAKKTEKKVKEVANDAKAKAKEITKKDIKRTAIVEHGGNQFEVSDIIARCEAKFKADNKKKAYKDIKVYIKPENNAAYYVVDGKSADKIDLI